MRIFITGGTGLIGSAVVAELLRNGHTVLALARSDASVLAAQAAGAEPIRGGIADLGVLRAGVAKTDGVIHLAFSNDFSSAEAVSRSVAEETAALETLGEELVGSDRPLVTVSGTPWVPGRLSTEDDALPTDRSVVAAAPSRKSSAWPHKASAARPFAFRAPSTTRVLAVSPVC